MRLRAAATVIALACIFALSPRQPSAAQQPAKLKVHISVDMEGVAGAVTSEQLGPSGFEYGRFREFMTKESLAAVDAARAAGATEIAPDCVRTRTAPVTPSTLVAPDSLVVVTGVAGGTWTS